MVLEALSSNEFSNFIIQDTISSSAPCSSSHNNGSLHTTSFSEDVLKPCQNQVFSVPMVSCSQLSREMRLVGDETRVAAAARRRNLAVQGRKKRRRKGRICKDKEEAETQRMTHIAVERNRRKRMNEYLAVLRSLMPKSYVQRGDQASIVGGAIEFVKELEHLLQSLEAKKIQLLHGLRGHNNHEDDSSLLSPPPPRRPPFSQFFLHPQYTWSQVPNSKITSNTNAAIADIEVTLIKTRANIRILSRKNPKQLLKLVAGFQTLYLTILHINVTTMDPLVRYSISATLEEGCQLISVDDIAAAVHHMLRIIEEEAVQILHHHQLLH